MTIKFSSILFYIFDALIYELSLLAAQIKSRTTAGEDLGLVDNFFLDLSIILRTFSSSFEFVLPFFNLFFFKIIDSLL